MTLGLLRGTLAGLVAFIVAGLLFGRLVAALTPGEWSVDALNAAGLAAAGVDAVVGGAVGAWQSARAGLRGRAALAGAVLGPLIATLAIVASDPDASAWTISAVVLVVAAAAAGGRVTLRSSGLRPRGSRRGSARSRLRA
jgi:hypothetical protein